MFTSAEIKKFAIDNGFADANGQITDPNGLYEAAKKYNVSASAIGEAFGLDTGAVNSWLQSNQKGPLAGDSTVTELLNRNRTYGTQNGSVPTEDGRGWSPAMQPPSGIYGGVRTNLVNTPQDQVAWNSGIDNQANERSHYAMRIAGLTGQGDEMGMANDLSALMNSAAGLNLQSGKPPGSNDYALGVEQTRYANAMPAANKYLLARDVLEGRISGQEAEALLKRDELQKTLEQAKQNLAGAQSRGDQGQIESQTRYMKGLEESLAGYADKVPKSTEGLLYGSNPTSDQMVKSGGVWGLQAPQPGQQVQQGTQPLAQPLAQQPTDVKKKATAATNGTAGEMNPYLQASGTPSRVMYPPGMQPGMPVGQQPGMPQNMPGGLAQTPTPFMAAQQGAFQSGMVRPYTPATMNAAQMTPTQALGAGDFQTATSFGAPATPGAPSVAGSVARYDNPYLGQQTQRSANVGPNPYGMDNPYLSNAINAASADATKNFSQSVMPQLDRMMAASGSYGNTGIQQLQKDAFDTLGRNLGNISSNMRMQDYTQQQGLAENALNRGQSNNQFNSGLSAADLSRNLSGGFQQSAQNNQYGLDAAKFDASNQMQNQQFNANQLQGNNQFNAQNVNQMNLAKAGLLQGNNQFNAGAMNSAAAQNAGYQQQANATNAGAYNNAAAQYMPMAQQNNQFNAAALNSASANNANALNNMGQYWSNFDQNVYNQNWDRQRTGVLDAQNLANQQWNWNQQGLNAATQYQNTPLQYQQQFAQMANSAGGLGQSQQMPGNPYLGAIGGAMFGSSIYNNLFGGK